MNREQCVERVMERVPEDIYTKESGNRILSAVLDVIQEAVCDGERVMFIGFGTFEKASRQARTYTNFDGEVVKRGKTYFPKFTPHAEFKQGCKPKRGRPPKK